MAIDRVGETYRLATWRALDDRRIEWTEDWARVEAEVTMLTDTRLKWRLHRVGGDKGDRPPGYSSPTRSVPSYRC